MGREQKSEVFVIKKSDERIDGKKLTYSSTSIWKVKQKENWIAVDGQKINNDDYNIFQTPEAYYTSYSPSQQSSFFINRLRFGKINLYYYVHEALSTGTKQEDVRGDFHVYVFEKDQGNLEALTFDSFSAALNDNQHALQKLRQLYPNSKIPGFNEKGNLQNLIAVVELYNK